MGSSAHVKISTFWQSAPSCVELDGRFDGPQVPVRLYFAILGQVHLFVVLVCAVAEESFWKMGTPSDKLTIVRLGVGQCQCYVYLSPSNSKLSLWLPWRRDGCLAAPKRRQ
jgi:hypothetical protein